MLGVLVLLTSLLRFRGLGEWPLDGEEARILLQQGRTPDSTPFDLRLLPAVYGTLTAIALYTLARVHGSAVTALCSLLLLALCPFHFQISTAGRADSWLFLCSTVGFAAWIASAGTAGWRLGLLRLLSAAAWALGIWVMPPLLCVIVPFLLAWVLLLVLEARAASLKSGGALVGLACIACFGMSMLIGAGEGGFGPQRKIARVGMTLVHDGGLALPVLMGFAVLRGDRLQRSLGLGLILSVCAVAGSSFNAVERRYVLDGLMPGLVLLSGMTLGRLVEAMSTPLLRLAAILIAVLPSVPGLLSELKDGSRHRIEPLVRALDIGDPRIPFEPYRHGELLLARNAEVVTWYSGIEACELPGRLDELEAKLPKDRRAFVVLLLQRGRAVDVQDPRVQEFIEKEMKMIGRVAIKRFDLHRFESRLYVWDGRPRGS